MKEKADPVAPVCRRGHRALVCWAHLSPWRVGPPQINAKMLWVISFSLWWNISILMGLFSLRIIKTPIRREPVMGLTFVKIMWVTGFDLCRHQITPRSDICGRLWTNTSSLLSQKCNVKTSRTQISWDQQNLFQVSICLCLYSYVAVNIPLVCALLSRCTGCGDIMGTVTDN